MHSAKSDEPRRCCFCLRGWSFDFFFFQAEDGIRDDLVTGVQTCALPICLEGCSRPPSPEQPSRQERAQVLRDTYPILTNEEIQRILGPDRSQLSLLAQIKIGRASCRERV